MVWREPKNHQDDCYFCMVDMTGWNKRKKKEWCYPDIESARQPVLHCAEVPVPTFTSLPNLTEDGGRGTKPTYIFMVIIPLLVIELKATPNGNPNDDFYWRQKSSSLNLVQIIPPVGLLYFTSKSI